MFQPLFTDLFNHILLDLHKTLMFGGDRLEDYSRLLVTYRELGGEMEDREVVRLFGDLLGEMGERYREVEKSDGVPGLLRLMKEHPGTSRLPEREQVLLDRTVAIHELGVVPPQNRDALRHLAVSNKLVLLSDIWGTSEVVVEYLKEVELFEIFDALIFSSDHHCAKPSEKIFRIALEAIGSPPPEKCLMIGDNYERDILGARRLGMGTILIAPARPPEPKCGDRVVADFEEAMRVR